MRHPVRAIVTLALVAFAALAGASWFATAAEEPVVIPPPTADIVEAGPTAVAVFAGGCFWGVQAVFQHTEGVLGAVSGYSGGTDTDPSYGEVSSGATGHAEAVEVTYDPSKVSYGTLLQIFFSVAHNPTQLNYQGPDHGTQYRSAIYTTNAAQAEAAAAYVAELDAAKVWSDPIVTELKPLDVFYPAEDYHQDYATLNPNQPYIAWNDLPKIAALKELFPKVWRDKPVLVFAANAS